MAQGKVVVKPATRIRVAEAEGRDTMAVLEITTKEGLQYFALNLAGCLSTARLLIRKAEQMTAPPKAKH